MSGLGFSIKSIHSDTSSGLSNFRTNEMNGEVLLRGVNFSNCPN